MMNEVSRSKLVSYCSKYLELRVGIWWIEYDMYPKW